MKELHKQDWTGRDPCCSTAVTAWEEVRGRGEYTAEELTRQAGGGRGKKERRAGEKSGERRTGRRQGGRRDVKMAAGVWGAPPPREESCPAACAGSCQPPPPPPPPAR
eukprot:760491-Hanusia_phi.AAC.1